jgi:hypothetical protein
VSKYNSTNLRILSGPALMDESSTYAKTARQGDVVRSGGWRVAVAYEFTKTAAGAGVR